MILIILIASDIASDIMIFACQHAFLSISGGRTGFMEHWSRVCFSHKVAINWYHYARWLYQYVSTLLLKNSELHSYKIDSIILIYKGLPIYFSDIMPVF